MAVGFMEDVVHLAKGKMFSEASHKIKHMYLWHGGVKQWATSHCSEFEMGKIVAMGFT
jgi:hypothetical protein